MSKTKQEPGPRQATRFLGELEQFWVFDLSGGGRVSIPPDQVRRMWNEEQARKVAAKAYEPPAETAKHEQLREELTELKEQEALAWKEANGLDDKLSLLHDQLVQSQAETLNGKELLAGKVLTIQQLRTECDAAKEEAAARLKQLNTQVEIHYRNTREWRVALDTSDAERDAARTECEQSRRDAEVVRMAEGFQERALKAELALITARPLLEEARLAMSELITSIRSMGPPWGLLPILNNAAPLFENADAVLAKIEASRTPEVKP